MVLVVFVRLDVVFRLLYVRVRVQDLVQPRVTLDVVQEIHQLDRRQVRLAVRSGKGIREVSVRQHDK